MFFRILAGKQAAAPVKVSDSFQGGEREIKWLKLFF